MQLRRFIAGIVLAIIATHRASPLQASLLVQPEAPDVGGIETIHFPNFSNIEGLNLVANARQDGNTILLTPPDYFQLGALWFAQKQEISDGFETTFQFRISDRGNDPDYPPAGGDGFAFVLQDSSATAIGDEVGGTIGYGGIARSVAIEFDIWPNDTLHCEGSTSPCNFHDPDGNHISVQTRGIEKNSSDFAYSLAHKLNVASLKDGNIHTVHIEYEHERKKLRIYLDDLSTSIMSLDLDIADKVGSSELWLGFTSATGASWASFHLVSWSFGVGTDAKAELGFRPNVNGFQFANRSIPRTWEMFEQYFGKENVRHSNGDKCIAAQEYFRKYISWANGWACLGFSQASLLSYLGTEQSFAGEFAIDSFERIYQKSDSVELANSLAYYAGVQTSWQWDNEYVTWKSNCLDNPKAMSDTLWRAIEGADPVVLSLNTFLPGWHTVTPYRIEQKSENEFRVYVYDSERPGEERFVTLANMDGTWLWTYNFVGSVARAGPITSFCTEMYPLSLSITTQQGVPPYNFCDGIIPIANRHALQAATTSPQLAAVTTSGEWLIQDEQGRKIGFYDGNAVSEIPDAYIIPQVFGEAVVDRQFVHLPTTVKTIEFEHSLAPTFENTLFRDGGFVTISGTLTSVSETARISLTTDLGQVVTKPAENLSSLTINLNRELDNQSHMVTINTTEIIDDESILLEFDGNQLVLKLNGNVARYDIEFQNAAGQREQYGPFDLKDSDTHFLVPNEWDNLSKSGASLSIDEHSDGTLDTVQPLDTPTIHLPFIQSP